LYLAREDGKELSDPGLNAAETVNAFIANTHHGIAADVLVEDLVRVQVGGEYITTTPEGIYGMAQHVKDKLAEFNRLKREMQNEV
jgi:hypothetical protein